MHPIVIVFLLFAAMFALYFLYLNPAVLGGLFSVLRAKLGVTDGQIIALIILFLALYALFYCYSRIADSLRRKKNR